MVTAALSGVKMRAGVTQATEADWRSVLSSESVSRKVAKVLFDLHGRAGDDFEFPDGALCSWFLQEAPIASLRRSLDLRTNRAATSRSSCSTRYSSERSTTYAAACIGSPMVLYRHGEREGASSPVCTYAPRAWYDPAPAPSKGERLAGLAGLR